MNREDSLLSIRPILTDINSDHNSPVELFQNQVLRPILKFQHDQLCFTFANFSTILKMKFVDKDDFNKSKIIVSNMKTNQKLKTQLIQSILSLMTLEELSTYQSNKAEFQKRILSMASQRIIDGFTSLK